MTINRMHPVSSRTSVQDVASDYPVRLLTRRKFSLSETQILSLRSRAPVGITMKQYQQGSQRPPC